MTDQPIEREISRIPLGMRPGRRELNEASLVVSMCEAVPEHMRPKMREITQVRTQPHARRKHLATALMNFVCQEADANGFTLLLTAEAVEPAPDAPTEEQLIAWYQLFGFAQLQPTEHGMLMARQIRVKPTLRIVSVEEAVHEALNQPRH